MLTKVMKEEVMGRIYFCIPTNAYAYIAMPAGIMWTGFSGLRLVSSCGLL
jgi:hypothetical protein